MGVPLRGRQRAVSEQLLDHADLRPALQEVRGERMAQRVGRKVAPVQVAPAVALEESAHVTGAEPLSASVEEQGRILSLSWRHLAPAGLQIVLQGLGGEVADGDLALLAALPEHTHSL